MRTKKDILEEIIGLGYPKNEIALKLDDFFDNEHCTEESIGVNVYPDQPAIANFFKTFKNLIASKKAGAVFVRICDIEEPEDWFFSDTVYVIGDLTLEELKDSVAHLFPDEIYDYWMYGKPINVPETKENEKIYSLWWD